MMATISTTLILILAFLVSLTVHEFCHALVAYLLGDDTAKQQGRLTLNPLAHIDPIGLLFLILVRIGWAKPVPFNPHNFSRPRLYSVLVGLAGPASNFLLALFFMYGMRYIIPVLTPTLIQHNFISMAFFLKSFFEDSIWINVMLGLFNLLPIPPLDGSHIIYANLPESWKPYYNRFQIFSIIFLVILLNIPAFQIAFNAAIIWVVKVLHSIVFKF